MDWSRKNRKHGLAALFVAAAASAGSASMGVLWFRSGEPDCRIVVSARDQKLALVEAGRVVKVYSVSTSKYGLGNEPGSYRTPVGRLSVARKIGAGAPLGAVFSSRRPTGEILAVDSPGRDPVVTRILWLRGEEDRTANVLGRYVYIHGTPEERTIGAASSYGCIRMRSRDVVDLFDRVRVGTEVLVVRGSLARWVETT